MDGKKEKLRATHPVVGEGWRLVGDEETLQAGDQTARVSLLLSEEYFEQWLPVEKHDAVGKTMAEYLKNDGDAAERVVRRRVAGEVREKLQSLMPYLLVATEDAKAEAGEGGEVRFGILLKRTDGSGKVLASFRAEEFAEDLARLLDAPPLTDEARADVRATGFLQKFGLLK